MKKALHSLDWSLAQTFLLVAETGSLSAAAREAGTSQPTLGRQIKAMETQLGLKLFDRRAKGLELTEAGQALRPAANAMLEAAARLATTAAGRDSSVSGTVRITASDFVSHYILPKIIAGLRIQHPDIQIELHPTDESDNLLFREADIALRMYRPTQLEVITKRLGVLPLGFFASKSYLQRRGEPRTIPELMTHDLLGYDKSERFIRGAAELGWQLTRDNFAFRCDQQTIHGEMIRAGAGIGVLQSKVAQQFPELVPVMQNIPVPGLEVWLTAHEAMRATPRISAVWAVLENGLKEWLSNDPDIPLMKSARSP